MKKEHISDALNMLNDDIIEETDKVRVNVKPTRKWIKWGVAAACLCLVLAAVIPALQNNWHNVTENEPRVELTLEEAMSDKVFGAQFPRNILEGYVLENSPGIYGVGDSAVLKAIFYNEALGDEMVIRIATKEWFHVHEKESAELNTIHYREKKDGAGSYIYFEGGDNIVSYSFTIRDIAQIKGFREMVESAARVELPGEEN